MEEINIFILIKESMRSKKEWVRKKNVKNIHGPINDICV